jgi:hypothetical protein
MQPSVSGQIAMGEAFTYQASRCRASRRAGLRDARLASTDHT